VTDRALARRYADEGDEAAFELLVRRHGDAVWAACRRVLRDHQAAEDAFQAAFLVLARKAGSIRTPCVAGWLYRVAVRAALRLRAAPACEPADRAAPEPDPDRGETAAVVHEEVARLAEKYRLPVVLCDLAGLTHAEAADRLGWPVGTVSGRLSVARNRLRDRLTRRGVTAPAVVAAFAAGPVSAAQIRVAVSNAVGGAVSPAVSSLTDGVLSAMRWTRIKLTAALASALLFAGVTAVVVVGQEKPTPRPAAPAAAPTRPADAPADHLKKLQQERLDVLKERLGLTRRLAERKAVPAAEVKSLEEKVALAEAELEGRTADVRAAYERWLAAAQERENMVAQQVQQQRAPMAELLEAREARLDAQIALARLPAK
jgi:RNA polymerase sigma factor (sigma-70 family)